MHRNPAGYALCAVVAVWSVGVVAASSIAELNQLAVDAHTHRQVWIRHEVSCLFAVYVATVMRFREIELDAL